MSPDESTKNNNTATRASTNTEQQIGGEKTTTNKFGLHQDDVMPPFRIPFITNGYREHNLKAVEYMQSAFIVTSNETINFWSHFIAFAMFLVKFHDLYSTRYSIYDGVTLPLLSAAVGVCGFCLASSVAHLFNSMSLKALQCCFFVDYAAISVYTVGMGQACFMYSRPLESKVSVFQSEWPFTVISVLISINATCMCCISTFRWRQHKYLIRTGAFVIAYIVNTAPIGYRILINSDGADTISPIAASSFTIHFILYVSAALVNSLRLPERIFPGVFDFFGHSHHLMHICTAIGACYQFDTFHVEMIARKDELMKQPIKGSPYNTILPLAISIVANFGAAVFFSKYNGKQAHQKEE